MYIDHKGEWRLWSLRSLFRITGSTRAQRPRTGNSLQGSRGSIASTALSVLVALSLLGGCVQATASCEPPCQEWADHCASSSEPKAVECVQECKRELDRYVTLECTLTYARCDAPVRYDCEVLP